MGISKINDMDSLVELVKPFLDEFGVELSVPLEADVGVGPWGSK